LPAGDETVVERISKASAYFEEKIGSGPVQSVLGLQLDTDNQTLKRKLSAALKFLREEMAVKRAAVKACQHGFSTAGYLRAVSAAALTSQKKKTSPKTPTYTEADIAHPDLFQILKDWRSQKAAAEAIAHYRVLHQKTLVQIAVNLPDTLADLMRIKGIGERLAERYGEELVALVGDYRKQHNIVSVSLPASEPAQPRSRPPASPRVDTKQVSLDLFLKGLTVDQIAGQRGLMLSTIEGHMAHWVAAGKVEIDGLVSSDKRQAIERELRRTQGASFGAVKRALGEDFSYGEIKLVQAHLKSPGHASGS
jgi:hypothetical protein